jgi:catechol 2,3-dioxygenase-like lactoylglutathione lyase family enzyme
MNITVLTLGVSDVARSRAFYEALGFALSKSSNENIAFFDAGGVVLAVYGRDALAEDACVDAKPTGSFTIAHNVGSEKAVDEALARAEKIGARILKRAQKVFWGGYSGYFADPDGHPWEVAYNPHWKLDDKGRVVL